MSLASPLLLSPCPTSFGRTAGAPVQPRARHPKSQRQPVSPITLPSGDSRREPLCCLCSSSSTASPMPLEASVRTSQVRDCLLYSRAFWVSERVIAWNLEIGEGSCYLCASRIAGLTFDDDGITGYDLRVELEVESSPLPSNVIEKFPHIKRYRQFKVPLDLDVRDLVKSQLAVTYFDTEGRLIEGTGLQLPGVLDELFSYDGPLGAHYTEEAICLHLWAPTAQAVSVCIYENPLDQNPMEIIPLKEANGVWSMEGPSSWEGWYYVYEVSVYHPSTLKVEICYANDPYARGISADGSKTLLVNLDSDDLKPEGWGKLAEEKPCLSSFSDISIYELHVRDFSANDHSVDPEVRGGYLAFTLTNSAGVNHLKKLSDAGLSHIHLLPTFQFGSVSDEKEKWKSVDTNPLEKSASDSPEAQAQITEVQNDDGYNWGYDPVLWGVPKGSYASNPSGSCRILEFRRMVQALNHIGLRIVLDVVYNHLYANGPHDKNSVLDKIVPGYYLRMNHDGFIENSTCVNNTASEHFMAGRLIHDDLLNWAVNYKVDGFRFDLMGHLMKSTMVKAKEALSELTKETDGVDGSSIYLYGEGWDFGEVAQNGRGINASQFNLCGTGIGSFNDRIRDAILGGSPFGHPLQQGFITGLLLRPNSHDQGSESDQELMLSIAKDKIEVGMAANLKDFVLTDHEGKEVKGSEVLRHDGTPVAYASQPTETINYVSAHDNETLFDIISMKTPMGHSAGERCQINHLASSMIGLSQGIPFFHAGDEILRSKSLDRDSYNSGDWFNRLDFSYSSNNWGVGLPPREKNKQNWPLIKPRLRDPSFKPQSSHIISAFHNFLDVLRIRYSSPLFRLRTANNIQERVRFHNSGPSAIPGAIVMSIEDGHKGIPGLSQIDPLYSYIVVIFNARPSELLFHSPVIKGRNLKLHPIQIESEDEVVKKSVYDSSSGCFTVPGTTTSVFVEPRNS
ncbi:PREDICTED: pullulanase 1, chloroplastic [Tarenaya hassleriana]|uniref:pullulanase 1, chloroplastic n=1 Tax=Tarenaya hassleriana TaxID=28532 RepID=UPI00053C507C|nr:PREDICTED: pullulanase 1, chloroplastic [Tarenaya hassleriana]